jgi:glycosyltransferase involved in cell wall biosynthesis
MRTLLALTETPDHVCGRYRVRAFAPALQTMGWELTLEGAEHGLRARLRQLDRAREFEAVLVQRKLLPGWQVDRLRHRARRLIFDFDDAILYRDSNDPRGPFSRRRERRFRRVVQAADAVIAGNTFLADCAESSGAARGRIDLIPTCITTEAYPANSRMERSKGIDLVWIGSSSTLKGLESQRAIWERVGREVAGARLRVICDRFPNFGPLPVVPVAWNEATEATELAQANIGVSWVPDDLWSRGKCGLKVLQYQAAGLPVVANPVGVHATMVRDGENGFLATSPDEWIEAIRTLRDDPGLCAAMGESARQAVETGYSVSAWGERFVSAIAGTNPSEGKTPHLVKLEKKGVEARSSAFRADQTAGC